MRQVHSPRPSPALVALALLCGACANRSCGDEVLTQVLVAVDSDLSVPSQLDSISIEILRDPAPPLGPYVTLVDPVKRFSVELPVTLGVRAREDPEREIEVLVRGIRRTDERLERRARLRFVPGQVHLLCLRLDAACLGVTCGEDTTCAAGACVPIAVDVAALPLHARGEPIDCARGGPAPDAGVRDGGGADGGAPDGGPGPLDASAEDGDTPEAGAPDATAGPDGGG